jgi:hypothetical protein
MRAWYASYSSGQSTARPSGRRSSSGCVLSHAVLQQWTLANQTGRGDDITAALDKFVAASPIVVAAVIEAYWLGAEGSAALSWRHHAVAALWSAFAITDFFATDITNQRLRARQFNVGDGAG